MIVFIEGHWIVGFDSVEPPLGQGAGLAVQVAFQGFGSNTRIAASSLP
jgi:hypothetical protein